MHRWFTVLMRTYKIGTILLFQADASDKEEDPRQERGGGEEDEGCTECGSFSVKN
jgi:hypothetical protein